MTPEEAQERLRHFATSVGREVRVFKSPREAAPAHAHAAAAEGEHPELAGPSGASASTSERDSAEERSLEYAHSGLEAEPRQEGADDGDDFYEFTAFDYARVLASRKEERFLKPRQFREQELQEKRNRIQKAVIRVLFPDGHVVEATFSPPDAVSDIRSLIAKCLRNPTTPFHFFTTPPKRRIKDETQDLYSAQLAPGALIHFAAEEGAASLREGPADSSLLSDDVLSLRDLHLVREALPQAEADEAQDAIHEAQVDAKDKATPDATRTGAKLQPKKPGVPKWFRK